MRMPVFSDFIAHLDDQSYIQAELISHEDDDTILVQDLSYDCYEYIAWHMSLSN